MKTTNIVNEKQHKVLQVRRFKLVVAQTKRLNLVQFITFFC